MWNHFKLAFIEGVKGIINAVTFWVVLFCIGLLDLFAGVLDILQGKMWLSLWMMSLALLMFTMSYFQRKRDKEEKLMGQERG